ncbi:hypothetical protein Bca4012_010108 [Brassica carinata]
MCLEMDKGPEVPTDASSLPEDKGPEVPTDASSLPEDKGPKCLQMLVPCRRIKGLIEKYVVPKVGRHSYTEDTGVEVSRTGRDQESIMKRKRQHGNGGENTENEIPVTAVTILYGHGKSIHISITLHNLRMWRKVEIEHDLESIMKRKRQHGNGGENTENEIPVTAVTILYGHGKSIHISITLHNLRMWRKVEIEHDLVREQITVRRKLDQSCSTIATEHRLIVNELWCDSPAVT